MEGMLVTIRLEDLEPSSEEEAAPSGLLRVIVKAREPGYVPEAAEVRARIDAFLFTADIPAQALDAVRHDPNVVSVSAGKKLRLVE